MRNRSAFGGRWCRWNAARAYLVALLFASLGFLSIPAAPVQAAAVPLVELFGNQHALGRNGNGSVTIIPAQTVQRTLQAGTYRVTPMLAKNDFAWNPFNTVQNCDESGGNCSSGWMADYALGTGGFDVTFSTPSTGKWLSDVLAFSQAVEIEFTLTTETTIFFWLTDGDINNQGGMKLNVQVVPLPGALLLLMSALGGLGLLSARAHGRLRWWPSR